MTYFIPRNDVYRDRLYKRTGFIAKDASDYQDFREHVSGIDFGGTNDVSRHKPKYEHTVLNI